ncbi:MAG: HEAT repeat domain-containing protein [Nitrospirae bacterium]|nr:HEAT repeat domain-containing protein [Nitrospirota bacterium]
MEEEKTEKLPIDAKLLSDAIIALNISRRSVSLYPSDHPITRDSLEKAYQSLEKLFELRSTITLGIAKDVLMIDDYVLDRKNPVYKEFAAELHSKGIAAVTFISGLSIVELLQLHEMIVSRDAPVGQSLAEQIEKRGFNCIRLTPLDLSKFRFVEGGRRESATEATIWENYIYGLLEGKLTDNDAETMIINIPPEDIAGFINNRMAEDVSGESYDRVITTYLKRKEHSGIKPEMFTRFMSLVENLSPDLKRQFLTRAFNRPSLDTGEVEKLVGQLTSESLDKIIVLFREHSSIIPDSIRNLLDKLKISKAPKDFFDGEDGSQALIDDIEIDDNIRGLFREDHFRAFVSEDYKRELERMLKGTGTRTIMFMEEIEKECNDNVIDRKFSDLALELLETDTLSREDYLSLLTPILENVDNFLQTGRFTEVSEIYNTIYSQALSGRFREEASGMLDYYFRSKTFIERFIEAVKIWGRHNREGVLRLANVQKRYLLDPLFDALTDENDPAVRRFLLQVLGSLGSDMLAEAVKRLNDKRWFVVRNMIYLIREAGDIKYARHIRRFAKDPDNKICVEAVKTLMHFRTPDAFSHVKLYLQGEDPEMKEQLVRLAGQYKYTEAVPYLLELFKKKNILGTESYYKTSLVKALGEIGDPRALPDLMKLYRSKTFLYKSALEDLKTEIFRNLQNYPPDAAAPLLEAGLKSKNSEIRSICEKLMAGKGVEDVTK